MMRRLRSGVSIQTPLARNVCARASRRTQQMEKGGGWRFFAATVLGIAGVMRLFDAIWAWSYHGTLPDNLDGALFGHSLKTYGWVYFIVALILIGSSFGIASGSQFSRWIGIVAGGVLAISSIWWMPYYPIWSLAYITIGILVIYALSAYGGRESVDGAAR
jgi:hypothetical protein